jgi:hypothetical protein
VRLCSQSSSLADFLEMLLRRHNPGGGGTPAVIAAIHATKNIAIVGGNMADPVSDGLVATLAGPEATSLWSRTTKQACACNSSTDHGGGKRRGFTAGVLAVPY